MRVVVKNVGEQGEIREVKNDLKPLQEIVGGYIEVYPINNNILIICNEEGKLNSLLPNIDIITVDAYTGQQSKETIVGNIAFASAGIDDFESLSDEQIEILKLMNIL